MRHVRKTCDRDASRQQRREAEALREEFQTQLSGRREALLEPDEFQALYAARFSETVEAAMAGRQVQPVLLGSD